MQQTERESSWARGRGPRRVELELSLPGAQFDVGSEGLWANSHLGAGRCSLWLSRGLHSVYSVQSLGKGGVQDAMLMGSVEVAQIAAAKFKVRRGPSSGRGLVRLRLRPWSPVCGFAERPQVPIRQGTPPGSLRDQPRAWMLPTSSHSTFHSPLLFGVQLLCHYVRKGYGIVCFGTYFEVWSLRVLRAVILRTTALAKDRST